MKEDCSQITPEILESNDWKRNHRFFHKPGTDVELELTPNQGFILRIVEIENDNYVIWHSIYSVSALNLILKAFGKEEIHL